MAKTIKLIFLKENGFGFLLKGRNLNQYNTMYKQAIQLFKIKHGPIETVKGVKKVVQIEPIDRKLTEEEKAAPTIGLIFVKEDNSTIYLTGEGFLQYQENFFTGKKYLQTEFKIKGETVKVTFT